jgi:hypothetical protein
MNDIYYYTDYRACFTVWEESYILKMYLTKSKLAKTLGFLVFSVGIGEANSSYDHSSHEEMLQNLSELNENTEPVDMQCYDKSRYEQEEETDDANGGMDSAQPNESSNDDEDLSGTLNIQWNRPPLISSSSDEDWHSWHLKCVTVHVDSGIQTTESSMNQSNENSFVPD